MYLISGRHHGFSFGYDFLNLLCQCKLVGGFGCGNGEVDRVEPVDTVIRCGLLLGTCHPHQTVERDHVSVLRPDGNLRRHETVRAALRGTYKPYPFGSAAFLQFAYTEKLPAVTLGDGVQNILYRYTGAFKLHIVIHYPPFHGCGTAEFHLIHPVQCRKQGLYALLPVLLYHYRSGRSIQRIGHERTRRVVIASLGGDERVAHTVGKLRPQLSDKCGHLKPCGIYIRMPVKLYPYISTPVVGSGGDVPYTVHPRQHPFQAAGHLRLNHPCRVARHGERDRKPGHVT